MTAEDQRIIQLGNGWYRIPEGWTEDEVLDDLRAMSERGGSRRVTLREEHELAELVRQGFRRLELAAPDPVARLREALVAWSGEWPPTQAAIAEKVGWADGRSVRAACSRAETNWKAELERAERNRPA